MAVILPVAPGSTVMVTVAEAPLATLPSAQLMVGAVTVQDPCEGVADAMVLEAPDSVTVAVVVLAAVGPLLVTVVV